MAKKVKQRGWNTYKFCNISVNFEDTKMVDHILKISRPGVFKSRCLSWNTAIIVFMKKCRMDQRRYKSRHWIPMFIGTPCIILVNEFLEGLEAYNNYKLFPRPFLPSLNELFRIFFKWSRKNLLRWLEYL